MKTFISFLTEAKKVKAVKKANPIKDALANTISAQFNEEKTLTKEEFIDLFYEAVLLFIKEYLSDHDLEEITKEQFFDKLYEVVFTFIKEYLSDHDLEEITKKEMDKEVETNNDNEDILQDLVSIITSFTARIYGLRRSKRKTEKIIEELKNEDK